MSIRYILNAFSFNMLDFAVISATNVLAHKISIEKARELAQGAESAVGHPDTARVFSSILQTEVPAQRVSVTLKKNDVVLVGQYQGPRLPEGATELPEGAHIQWLYVKVYEASSAELDLLNVIPAEVLANCKHFIRTNRFIMAIKEYREHTGSSLADAKRLMDWLRADMQANGEKTDEYVWSKP